MDVIIGYPRTGGETDADFEEGFAHAVDISWSIFVDRLLMHWLPKGTRFDSSSVEGHAKCLNVVVRLAVGRGS